MAQAKYSKLGYGNAEDVEAAIALGMLDGRDMIITKDSSEFMYAVSYTHLTLPTILRV